MIFLTVQAVQGQTFPVQYREAGEWLRQEYGTGARIMTRDAAAAYYAGGTMVALPYASLNEITAYADRHQATILVVSRADVQTFRPGLQALLETGIPVHGRWGLVHEIEPGSERDTLIFRLRDSGSAAE